MNSGIKTIVQYEQDIESEQIDPVEEINREIKNIMEYNPKLNAFITIFEENLAFGLSKINSGSKPHLPLFGLPLTVKDNIFLAGHKTTGASAIFQNYVPSVNADVVDFSLEAGCVPLGKTNMHELAMGATSTSSFFGPVRNPVDRSRIPGGSSGGSAVSVAMSKVPIVSLGTDTGGSVRIPAALCGVCGFKPTLGLLNTSGVIPLSGTLDHVGILTKNMEDMGVAFKALTRSGEIQNRTSTPVLEELTIGIPGKYFFEDCVPSVEKAFWKSVEAMKEAGITIIEDIEIAEVELINPTRLTIQLAEMYWFYQDLVNEPERGKHVAKDVMSFFARGSKVGMMEQMLASRQRFSLIASLSRALQNVDLIAMPTCLTTAPKMEDVLGQEAGSIRKQLVRNTELFNVTGFPSVTLPTNRQDSEELPTALEISGKANDDRELLAVGESIWNLIHRT